MPPLTIYQVDAFTGAVFGGNPAAVCLLPSSAPPLSDAARQRIAAEMNLSETAFIEPAPDAPGNGDLRRCSHFKLRWFTPTVEVPLCGHATLAAAAAVRDFQGEACQDGVLRFDTLSGELAVGVDASSASEAACASNLSASPPLLMMDFPLMAPEENIPAGLEAGSPLVKAAVGDAEVEEVRYAPPLRYLLVVLRGPSARQALESLRPSAQSLEEAYSGDRLGGVIVTAQGDGATPHDFLSRFFAPWMGILEDPVTGSTHTVLAPYWAERLGRRVLRARQCSARGGELRVAVDAAKGRVEVAGQAVIVLKGELLLPEDAY